jgi:hypothetical protein
LPSKPGEFVAIYGNDSDDEDVCLPGRIRMWITEAVRYFPNAQAEVQFRGKYASKLHAYLSEVHAYFRKCMPIDHKCMLHRAAYVLTIAIGISYSRAKGLRGVGCMLYRVEGVIEPVIRLK